MKMMKNLMALALAFTFVFIGAADAEAYQKYSNAPASHDDFGCGDCHKAESDGSSANKYNDNQNFDESDANSTCAPCHGDAETAYMEPAESYNNSYDHTGKTTADCVNCHNNPTGKDQMIAGEHAVDEKEDKSADGLQTYLECGECHEGAPTAEFPIPNSAPVATDATLTVNEDTVDNEGTVTATDADAGDTLTFTATQPAHGVVEMATDGTYTYTPAANYFGTDSFEFTVTDAAGATDTGTVSITVTDVAEPVLPPADTDEDGLTDEQEEALGSDPTVDTIIIEDDDQALAIVEDGKVTGEITDMANATKYIITQGKYGTVTIAADGTWTYTVNPTATLAAAVTDTFTIQYVNTKGEVVNYKQEVEVTPASIDSIPWTPLGPSTPGETTPPPTLVDPDGEEDPESTNPETGGTAGLMLSLAATTVAGAGLVVFRKKN